ncbi:hypothetical protein ASD12_18105 [Mesorhizobium sp. Root102]|uniref:DUF2190 family protein n=1 Tax=Mesorhizobium sp. Root102 TaxID=1736422 RepID=UPI000701E09E|nr:DUF2190 family protein [Mesorhizobium sp. Root102]KQU77714.1 hypothetical protein ASD12_18105 [Mesorhizobium sp. Root102]
MKNYIQPGNEIAWTNEDVTDAVAVASGDGVVAGSLFGVANGDIAVGDEGTLSLIGVFELAKVSAQAWTFGQKIYWVAADAEATSTAGSNKLIGVAVEAADNPSATGKVRLSAAFTV